MEGNEFLTSQKITDYVSNHCMKLFAMQALFALQCILNMFAGSLLQPQVSTLFQDYQWGKYFLRYVLHYGFHVS